MKTNKTLKEVFVYIIQLLLFQAVKKDSKDAPTILASPSYFYHLHFCIVKTLLLQEVLYTPNQVVEDGSGSFSLNHFPKGGVGIASRTQSGKTICYDYASQLSENL